MQASSLYVHFPFCETKCHYCDFYSIGRERTHSTMPSRFLSALHREAQLTNTLLADRLDTIFFGGGTPSMTSADHMREALAPLALNRRTDHETEWTMEANPSSVTLDSLRAYRALGVNRLSFGVQSLNDHELKLLGRAHDRESALKALTAAFEAGFTAVSADLICGVPDQSLDSLARSIEGLLQFPLTHISCYLLTLPKSNSLYGRLPDETTQLQHLLFIDQALSNQGFEHYEISNFARPGKQARHNLAYWTGKSYLGMGPSAHSYEATSSPPRRWRNLASLERYAHALESNQSAIEETEALTPAQQTTERWMLALRLNRGFPVEWLESPHQQAVASRLTREGLLEFFPHDPSRLRLTAKGFALSDSVIQALSP